MGSTPFLDVYKRQERGDAEAQERLLPDMDRLSAWQYEQEATAILHALRITDVELSLIHIFCARK